MNQNFIKKWLKMFKILKDIRNLKNSQLKKIIDLRMKEFENLGMEDSEEIFKELCFCLLTANFSAHGGIKIQKEIGDNFLKFDEENLSKKLSELGYRFPNTRAKYIFMARKYSGNLKEILDKLETEEKKREWLVENIKGLGMKEASHFLRNIGYNNLAIIDFHIINLLVKEKLIEEPKNLNEKKYLEIEDLIRKIAQKVDLKPGELDLYLWYMETGKVLK